MSRIPSSGGFTLVEVLVALSTVSVLVLGASALLSIASSAVRAARLTTAATLLAVQKVEQLDASPSSLSPGTMHDYFAADGSPTAATTAALVRRWTVTPSWASTSNFSVVVEVFAPGVGRVADIQAVVDDAGGAL